MTLRLKDGSDVVVTAQAMQPIPFPEWDLTDGRVTLRAWCDADIPVKATWGGDREIARWTGVPSDYDEQGAATHNAGMEVQRLAGTAIAFAVCDAATGELVGACDLRFPDTDDRGRAEVGYLVAEEHRGQGFASAAVELLLEWAFDELGVGRCEALVHPGNAASVMLLTRLGFTIEGALRDFRVADGIREDRLLLSLLSRERHHATP